MYLWSDDITPLILRQSYHFEGFKPSWFVHHCGLWGRLPKANYHESTDSVIFVNCLTLTCYPHDIFDRIHDNKAIYSLIGCKKPSKQILPLNVQCQDVSPILEFPIQTCSAFTTSKYFNLLQSLSSKWSWHGHGQQIVVTKWRIQI